MKFEVMDMDGRRIDKVLVARTRPVSIRDRDAHFAANRARRVTWRRGGDGQHDVRRLRAGSEDALRGRDEVGRLREKDVRHELLRVPIDHREPGALHLHHDAVPGLERVIVGGERNHVLDRNVRRQRGGLLDALVIPAADHVAGNHQLESAHRLVRELLGIDVDQLHDPVAVGAAGGGKQMRVDLTRRRPPAR